MSTTLRAVVAALAIAALLGAGCFGTTYQPREPGRIHFLMDYKGDDVLEKDGKRYPLGELGTSPDFLAGFKANPAADAHARIYRQHQVRAKVWAVVTGVALGIGIFCLALAATPPDRVDASNPESSRTGLWIVTGMTSVGGAAALYNAARESDQANAHLYDAIN